ncbi:unnamed protein product, partial [Iphiclides podalirius]
MKAWGEDMGKYSCLLSNAAGNGTTNGTIDVNILYKPQVRLIMSPRSPILETEHRNVTLICEVVSGNPSTLDEVIWYLDNEVLKHLPECNDTNDSFCNDVDPSMLLLQDTTKSFHGNYSCKGKNSVGWGSESAKTELIVNYPPGPAKLTYFPWRIIKGQSLELTCTVEEKGRPESIRIRWHRDGRLVSDVVTDSWTIDPVTLDHRANFSCRGNNSAGEGPPAYAAIDVLAPPSFKYAMNQYSGALYRSQDISLSCTVECAPLCSVQWLKDGQVIDLEKTDRYYVVERNIEPQVNRNDFEATESTLHWNMSAWAGGVLSRAADGARYTCRSSRNAAGPSVNSTTTFAVEYEPENITVTPQVVSVVENKIPGKVVCSAKGFPMPNYSWQREQPVKGQGEEHARPTLILSTSSTLLLGPVTRKDAGRYVCEAYNKHGKVNSTVYLDVTFVPECGIKQIEKDGEQVLACTANSNPAEVTFSWRLKNENDSLTDERIWQSGSQSFLRLNRSIPHYRTYNCYAANSVGVSKPCERGVEANLESNRNRMWWRDQYKLLLFGGVALSILIVTLVLCIIIFRCRRIKNKSKYVDNNPMELDERVKFLTDPTPDVLRLTTIHPSGQLVNFVDNITNGNPGAENPVIYENLPFHSVQQPPNQNINTLKKQYISMKNLSTNVNTNRNNQKNFEIPLQHPSSYYIKQIDKWAPSDQKKSCNPTIGPIIWQTGDEPHCTKTLNRTRKKNNKKLNRMKRSESLKDKLSYVGVYNNYERPNYHVPENDESRGKSYLQLQDQNCAVNFNTLGPKGEWSKHKKHDLALDNHNMKFKNTVNSNKHRYDGFPVVETGINKITNSSYKTSVTSSQRKRMQNSDRANVTFGEIDI